MAINEFKIAIEFKQEGEQLLKTIDKCSVKSENL